MSHCYHIMGLGMILILCGAVGERGILAQVPLDEHTRHHSTAPSSEQAPASAPADPAPAAAVAPPTMPGMDMGRMMEDMVNRIPRKPLVSQLLDAERLSAHERTALQDDAERQSQKGLQLLEEAFQAFVVARQAGDEGALDRAVKRLQEGGSLWETSAMVRRALSSPDADLEATARQWFKVEMNLESALPIPSALPWGLSWVHLGGMVALGLFVTGMVVVYLYKVRQSLRLLDRLTRVKGNK